MTTKQVYKYTAETQERCLLCGYGGETVMHHIRFGAGGRKTYVGNLAVLCVLCHVKVHQNDKKYRPILIKKVNRLYDL